jgi:hypothetical protein
MRVALWWQELGEASETPRGESFRVDMCGSLSAVRAHRPCGRQMRSPLSARLINRGTHPPWLQ